MLSILANGQEHTIDYYINSTFKENTIDYWLKKGFEDFGFENLRLYDKFESKYDWRNYSDAVRCFNEVIKVNPSEGKAWYYKGLALRSLGSDLEADAAFGEAKALQSKLPINESGQRILFERPSSRGGTDLYLIDLNGANETRLFESSQGTINAYVSPDSRKVAVLSAASGKDNGAIYTVNLDGTELTKIDDDIVPIDILGWSPNGKWLTYLKNDEIGMGDLNNIGISDGKKHLCFPAQSYSFSDLNWSPDGNTIAYIAARQFNGSYDCGS